ncbi:MAG: bifunctional folylpolyglutamate synthase/dihydrofolate synthase [Bacteroidetes bacterium]|nr:bifunctional folylpolyglutamate synthase/dihydrofolate synthase [Bacteroidota bacterium]
MSFTYSQALDYLLGQLPMFQRVGPAAYRADLGNITALCKLLGNPQNAFKSIHIAGTNGKGSVTHILAAVLQAHGYKVGVFTSPHYKDYRERIKINGNYISESYVTSFIANNLTALQSVNASFFEVTTAMAFAYFKEENVDFAIIETGMGGRLDSTNIITPVLSVITNISFDHQQFLGNTLPEIAAEKAGIIKPGIPVAIGETHAETASVFLEKSEELNSPIVFSDKKFQILSFEQGIGTTQFKIATHDFWFSGKYWTDLSGGFQSKNLITAFSALSILKDRRIVHLKKNNFKQGLYNIKTTTKFIGRWMVMGKKPLIIFDSAHNEAGLLELKRQIFKLKFNKLHFVYGTVADKDLTNVFKVLVKGAHYYFCKPDILRGKDANELAQEAREAGINGECYVNVKQALEAAKKSASPNDLIVVSGSIFVVAEVL